MLVTGDFIGAEEARAKGLVNRVVDADRLDAEVEALLSRIVAKPRVAHGHGQGAVLSPARDRHRRAAYADAGRTMACNMMDGAALEGVQAFIDKRKPDWR